MTTITVTYLTVTGTVNFAGIAPVAGGYQVELVLQNTVPFGGGSVAWRMADYGLVLRARFRNRAACCCSDRV